MTHIIKERLMSRGSWLLALCSSLLAAGALAEGLPHSQTKGLSLLKEGDAHADRGKTTEAVLSYKLAFEQLLPGMRGVPFKSEVARDVTAREELQAYLIKEFDSQITPQEMKTSELGAKALGLLPRDFQLKETMIRLYSEEIAAFYDTKTKKMHLIKEPEKKKAPGLLEMLLGKTGGFDKDENKTVIAHELTHALADQNFDIDRLQATAKGDDDRSLAVSALVEGEATLTMLASQMEDWTGVLIKALPSEDLDRAFSFMSWILPFASGPTMRKAPPILVESMLFPYLRGLVFCSRLVNSGGWKAIDDAYADPPLSTEQILHPEKYRKDFPTAVELGELGLPKPWSEVGRNVVGEMQLAVLLRSHGGKPAAAGWDGDRFAVFENPEGRIGLVWFSTWDSPDEAKEFAKAYVRFQTTKLGKDAVNPEAFPDAIRRPSNGRLYASERRGSDVVVVEGFEADETDRLIEAAFRSKKTEIRKAEFPKPKEASAAKSEKK